MISRRAMLSSTIALPAAGFVGPLGSGMAGSISVKVFREVPFATDDDEIYMRWARSFLQRAMDAAKARKPGDPLSEAELDIAPRSAGGRWPYDFDFEETPYGLYRVSWWGRKFYPDARGFGWIPEREPA